MDKSKALVPIKSMAIVSVDDMKSNKELGKALVLHKSFSGDEKTAMIKNLVALDDAIAKNNKKNLKFSDDIIDVEFETIDSKYELKVPLGEGHFSKDFKHLVAIGTNDLTRIPVSNEVSNAYKQEVKQSFGIKNMLVDGERILFNTFEGGIKAIQTLAEMSGDNECAKAFSDNLAKTYQSLNLQKSFNRDNAGFNTDMINNFKELSSVMKSMPKSKTKQREITNHKDLGRSV